MGTDAELLYEQKYEEIVNEEKQAGCRQKEESTAEILHVTITI